MTKPWTYVKMKRTLAQYGLFLFFTGIIFTPIAGWLNEDHTIVLANENPIQYPEITPEPTKSTETSEQQEIKDYIAEVFGDDTEKAMLILTGNDKCGGENKTLNPKAINTYGNTPAGSRDIGIFQINEYHQDVNAKFLLDWKLNIQIAHKIYVDSGNNFKMWSAGKCMGI